MSPINAEPSTVGLLSCRTSPLGAGLAAALVVDGYSVDVFHDADDIAHSTTWHAVLVLDGLVDEPARLAAAVSTSPSKRWVCLGSLPAAHHLVTMTRLDVPVLNPDVPFTVLVSHLERLMDARIVPARTHTTSLIERRAAESAALARLTRRERAVLCQLMRGHSVEQIAECSARTVHTIRSQVQSLLRGLNARSQVEAVAIGYRSGATPLRQCLDEIFQYDS